MSGVIATQQEKTVNVIETRVKQENVGTEESKERSERLAKQRKNANKSSSDLLSGTMIHISSSRPFSVHFKII